MKEIIKTYIINLYYAILNKPIIKTVEIIVDKEHIVTQPLNMTQLQYLEKMFPLPVWEEGMSVTEVAYKTGHYRVVEFIKAWSAKGGRV